MRIAVSTLLFSLLASGVSATGQGNGNGGTTTETTTDTTTTTGSPTGGACSVSYSSVERGNSGKFVEEFVQDPNNACADSTDVCVPDDDTGSTDFQPGTCQSQTCQGKQKPGIIEGVDDDASNEATIRVTICHRTCSATNPWVRITIDDDAWGGPAASGCGHQLQHNVTEDCNVPAKEAQSGMTADEIWGVGRRVDYLIKNHGTRETLRTNMGWDEAACNNNGKCRHSQEEKDYWFYWERACPYVRHGACCGSYETGACCGDNPYPNVNTDIKLKKYACLASADCSGTGVPDDCEDGLLTLPNGGADTKYCYTVENAGVVDICGIEMSDPLFGSTPAIGDENGCLGVNSDPVWVEIDTSPPAGTKEESSAVVSGTPVLDGAVPVTDYDDASIYWEEVEEISTPPPASIALKKYACDRDADCSGSGIPTGCVDDLLTRAAPADTKYCFTVDNTGADTLCSITMSDPIDSSYRPSIGDANGCLPPNSGPVWVDTPMITTPTVGTTEESTATVRATPSYEGAEDVSDSDPASILLVETGIAIKKYACPGDADCSGSGIPEGCVDDLLTLAAPADTKYCFTVENTGDSEICGITMSDPLDASYNPAVGTGGCFDPSSGPVWVDTPLVTTPTVDITEESTVTVTGTPTTPGAADVTDSDPASILLLDIQELVTSAPRPTPRTPAPVEEIATSAPRPAPRTPAPVEEIVTPAPRIPASATPGPTPSPVEGCPVFKNTSDDVCPSGVSIATPFGNTVSNPPPNGIFHDISFTGTADAPTITFKVSNPFDADADVYVEFSDNPLSNTCEKDTGVMGCHSTTAEITAICEVRDPSMPAVALIDIYFATQDTVVPASDRTIPKCCYEEEEHASYQKIQYHYMLYCGCPTVEITRRLRGAN